MLEQILAEVARQYPEKAAIVYDQLRITYRELEAKVSGFSQGLRSIGIGKSDCIAVVLPNCPEFVVSFFAAAKLNAIFLPLNHLYKEEEIGYYLNDSNAKVVITDTKRAELCRQVISETECQITIITVDKASSETTYFEDLVLSKDSESKEDTSGSSDFLYQYSSGSTGRPKRVGRTQKNLYHEVSNFTQTAAVTPADNILCIVPLYHAHGLGNCMMAAICTGATLVILEQVWQQGVTVEVPFVFRSLRVLELLETEKISILPAVPYIFNALAQAPGNAKADLSNLRLCFSAGNFLPQEIFDKFSAKFGIPVRQLYGCTEAGSIALNLDEDVTATQASVGRPLNNVEIKIVDDEGRELPVGEIGEVTITSLALTSGYHNLPELNQQAFRNGAYFTGDLGKLDENGCLYITGRKKILIDTGGRKVDPIEIEDVLISHSQIAEAVVVGVKGYFAGEIVKAVIVPKGGECQESEISAYCRQHLAEFKVPKIIEFREEIPKSPLGKILRKALV
ncbi:class I adenylate-forming enzyme family protein [Myxosarcina sp. GI1]|uniref:class I adenylate-forming enzyme family protein n=1 Tax=Myxosarcina sp. GI1 TaxID=1541065 RepID=UPI00055E027A|nr:class I adenylate-forming enzyme family protein [Myxosarcina sp. GI1]